jgi:formylglycine-generating enzyme required for sulfatase activity
VDTTVATIGGRDLFLSRETDEGFSGGPVLVGGAVAGIVYGHEGGFGKALGASSIKPFIEGNSLTWGTVGAVSQPPVTPQPRASQEPVAGATRVNTKDGLTYVWIPPGKFTMGCSPGDSECLDDEKPAHEVTITRGFWMGQAEATVAAYLRYTSVPTDNNPDTPGLPVVSVTWEKAKAYCEWEGLRLPTEAEWEYAARAGTTGPRYGALDDVAWFSGNRGGSRTHPARGKQPNAWGLYDMLGNVWEWVADWFGEKYYEQKAGVDPTGPSTGTLRVLRGGSWNNNPGVVRASLRSRGEPTLRVVNIGFRCAGELR